MAHTFGYAATETLSGNRTITTAEIAGKNIFSFAPAGARDR